MFNFFSFEIYVCSFIKIILLRHRRSSEPFRMQRFAFIVLYASNRGRKDVLKILYPSKFRLSVTSSLDFFFFFVFFEDVAPNFFRTAFIPFVWTAQNDTHAHYNVVVLPLTSIITPRKHDEFYTFFVFSRRGGQHNCEHVLCENVRIRISILINTRTYYYYTTVRIRVLYT